MATEVYVDRDSKVEVWSSEDMPIPHDDIIRALRADPMIDSLTKWSATTQGRGYRSKGSASMFDRDRYVTPDSIFDQFRVAQDAVEHDDVVAGWMDTTEALAFSQVGFSCGDPYQTDVWNQIADNISLDDRMREMWRGFATTSQVYPCVWWGPENFNVTEAKTPTGKASKKTFRGLIVPQAITHLDPLKIMPVGNLLFNQEQLAYIPDSAEIDALDAVCNKDPDADPMARELIVGSYKPTDIERRLLGVHGVSPDRLFLLNPSMCYRYTATRMQYERFAAVRLKPVMELLDMKHQLRQMDRAFLVGGTNFILLVTLGSDRRPAQQAEIDYLNASVKMVAQMPVIVGDHRLDVKIVTPPQDHTLDGDKYAALNAPITAYLYRMFMTAHLTGGRSDDQVKIAKIVARGLQSARTRQAKAFERFVVKRTMDLNKAVLDDRPVMEFRPRRIELDFDPALAQLLLDMYDRRDVSRDTVLSLVELDQAEEAEKKQMEKEVYDDTFQTQVPYNGPAGLLPSDPKAAGRAGGGTRNGGGAAPGSGQGKEPADPRPKTTKRRAGGAQ